MSMERTQSMNNEYNDGSVMHETSSMPTIDEENTEISAVIYDKTYFQPPASPPRVRRTMSFKHGVTDTNLGSPWERPWEEKEEDEEETQNHFNLLIQKEQSSLNRMMIVEELEECQQEEQEEQEGQEGQEGQEE